MKTINKVTSEKLSSMTTDLLQMPKRLLALACMACLTSVCVLAQSKFHVDLDYNYNLGLSQRFAGHTMSRKDFSMGGHALQLAGRYDSRSWCRRGALYGVRLQHVPGFRDVEIQAYKESPSGLPVYECRLCGKGY